MQGAAVGLHFAKALLCHILASLASGFNYMQPHPPCSTPHAAPLMQHPSCSTLPPGQALQQPSHVTPPMWQLPCRDSMHHLLESRGNKKMSPLVRLPCNSMKCTQKAQPAADPAVGVAGVSDV